MIIVNQKDPDSPLLEWILWSIHWLELDDNNISCEYCYALDVWFIFTNFEDTWKIIGIDQYKVLYILYALLIIKLTILQIKMRKAALTISDNDAETNERFQTFTALVNGILILL